MNHNLWFSEEGVMAYWFAEKIRAFEDYQRATRLDAQSVFADPKFVDPTNSDCRPSPDSPARTLRTDGGLVGAESLWSLQ